MNHRLELFISPSWLQLPCNLMKLHTKCLKEVKSPDQCSFSLQFDGRMSLLLEHFYSSNKFSASDKFSSEIESVFDEHSFTCSSAIIESRQLSLCCFNSSNLQAISNKKGNACTLGNLMKM